MTTLVHILMILFGFITFVIVKNKRYKDVPFISFIMIFSFVGFGIISVLTIFVSFGKLLLFPLACIVFGLIFIWLCHIIWLIFNRKYCLIIVDK